MLMLFTENYSHGCGVKYSPSAKSLLDKFPPHTPSAPSSHEPLDERGPLAPMIVEAVSPFDDPNRSAPPSPALPQPHVECVHLNGLQYQIPVPQMPPSPMIGGSNMGGTEDVIDNTETVSTTSNPALVAASAAWNYGKENGKINGNANGVPSKQVKPALYIPPANGGDVSAQNGKGKDPSTNIQDVPAVAERATERSSGASTGGSGRNSPAPARHTGSGFADIAGEEGPVSSKTVPTLKNQLQQNGKGKVAMRGRS
ncbi:hypothetical protein EV426DRAFT_240860 [Tirmania nivea]|nr:hypothetical protein EV426DRAFT_240860 [Tirmania nivea]